MRLRRGRKNEPPPMETAADDDLMTGAVRIIRPEDASTTATEQPADSSPASSSPADSSRADSSPADSPVADSPLADSPLAGSSAPDLSPTDSPLPDNAFLDHTAPTNSTEAVPVSGRPTDTSSSDSRRKRRGRRRSVADVDADVRGAVEDDDTVIDGPDSGDDGAERGAPGGDPLLNRGRIDEDAATAPPIVEPPDAAVGLGRNGVRVIPATSGTAGSSETASGLDPTAPYTGPIGDDEDLGSSRDGLGDDLGSGVTVHPASGDGTGEADGSRATIVINDDGTSAVAAETGVSRGRIDPKFRARRKAVRRSMGRKRIAVLLVGVVVVFFGVVVGALLGSPLFALKSSAVNVTGWKYADEAEMYAIFDDLAGTPVLRIDEEEVEARLEAVPWVEQAVVDTKLPNSADIQIRERVPLATYQGEDGRFRVLDRKGRVLEIVDGMPVEYMWITVSDPPNLEPGEFAATGIAAASEMTRSLTPTIRPRVRRIAVDQSGSSMAVYLRDGTRVNFGAARDIFAKLVRLETLLTDFPGMSNVRIDVSTAETTRSSASLLELTDGASEASTDDETGAAADDQTETSDEGGTGTGDDAGDEATGDGN